MPDTVPTNNEEAEAREMLGDHARREDIEAMTLSLIFQKHYIESDPNSPDNFSHCVCGGWSEGSMEPGWDDHLGEVAIEAGFRLSECLCYGADGVTEPKCPACVAREVEVGGDDALEKTIMDALDSLWATNDQVLGKLHARDEILGALDRAVTPSTPNQTSAFIERRKVEGTDAGDGTPDYGGAA